MTKNKFIIPGAPVDPVSTEPQSLIIYSAPKTGKTTLVAQLPNSLIVEHETNGAAALKARYIEVNNPNDISALLTQLKTDKTVDIIVIDTITKWDEWSELIGTYRFMDKPQGKRWNLIDDVKVNHLNSNWQSVHEMGEGYGYRYSREVMTKWYNEAVNTGKTIIFLAHIKDKYIESKSGDVVETIDLNLTGKVKSIYSTRVDAIAHFKRTGNKGYLVFEAGGSAAAGSRYAYLSGSILISESDENKVVHTYWDKIFPSLFKKEKK